ncbi:bacillithiol biosynthesis cysteine-adding enzyme BshC [Bacillus testis]|uniref:bacillithiol biosynthesis cysteine-adding enzyme BshC n=1 Tax=Bacillus testis TaxID=1622072 RepID=UPI00067F28DF|nr:bacillithiol biosynthesis cysteine-adding enzyme BshC [Bacillus testis]
MEIKEIVLPSINQFASDYVKNLSHVQDFFHYDVKDVKVYEQRYQDLMERSFHRERLAVTIESYMERYGLSPQVKKNLARLKMEDSAVVIGGQQAGLLTGPLYTIHKVISIIKLANEQEAYLKRPIIPVFWIAGEDHDLDEVNHIYAEEKGTFSKKTYPTVPLSKMMVSDTPFEKKDGEKWLKQVFSAFEETEFTRGLYKKLTDIAAEHTNFTQFFSAIINNLFKSYGLLLIDAAYPPFREGESSFFQTLIKENRAINARVQEQQAYIKRSGYKPAIEMDERNANLFFYSNGERTLLEYDCTQKVFTGKNRDLSFTEADLLELAKSEPWKLSNNVVTRPLMQEHMFPVLAFISGPGEIAYWAELKKAFEHLEMKLPIVVPRMNITILERKIQKDLQEVDMDLYEALVKGTDHAKKRFLASVEDEQLDVVFHKMEYQLKQNHSLVSEAALQIDKGLAPLLEKNEAFIMNQLQFLRDRIQASVAFNHRHILSKYTRIANALRPNGGPQERLLNIFYYLNLYGEDFIDQIMALELTNNSFHKVIVL